MSDVGNTQSEPKFVLRGNFISGQSMPPEHKKLAEKVMEDVTFINSLKALEGLE